MTQAARAPIDEFARHGGRIDMARAAFPQVTRWTDLSTGIAPWPYPVAELAASAEWLPDPAELAALEAAAAASFGADAARVVAVPGSDLAMRLLGLIVSAHPCAVRPAVVRPGYSGHAAMWRSLKMTECRAADIGAMARSHDVLVLARPNNPDGFVADRAQLETIATQMAARSGHLIVDEAFADAEPADSLAGSAWPGLIVLRSFGKFFGLAGLRLGFVIAPPQIAADLRALIGDWPISGPALATGLAAYQDADWQEAQRDRLACASQRLADLLAEHSIDIIGRTAFFKLVSVPNRDGLFAHLARAGVLTRPFDYEPDWLRIGLPRDDDDWARLGQALTTWSMI